MLAFDEQRGDQRGAGDLEQDRQADDRRTGRFEDDVEQRVPEQLGTGGQRHQLDPVDVGVAVQRLPADETDDEQDGRGGRVAQRGVGRGRDAAPHLAPGGHVHRREQPADDREAVTDQGPPGHLKVGAGQQQRPRHRHPDPEPHPPVDRLATQLGDQGRPDRLGGHQRRRARHARVGQGRDPGRKVQGEQQPSQQGEAALSSVEPTQLGPAPEQHNRCEHDAGHRVAPESDRERRYDRRRDQRTTRRDRQQRDRQHPEVSGRRPLDTRRRRPCSGVSAHRAMMPG